MQTKTSFITAAILIQIINVRYPRGYDVMLNETFSHCYML